MTLSASARYNGGVDGFDPSARTHEASLLAKLSARQRDVLELMVKGLTNEEIGGVLAVSPATVRTHITAIHRKLQVTNRTEAAMVFHAASTSTDQVGHFLSRPRIGVLKFDVPDAAAPDVSHLAFGLTEDIHHLLSRWQWFGVARVRQATSVEYVLRGGVRREGDRVVVTARFEDGAGSTVWSDRYELGANDLFDTRNEVAHTVVARAYPRLLAYAGEVAAEGLRDTSPNVWRLTHAAGFHLRGLAPGDLKRARDLASEALRQDPRHLPAHYVLGHAAFMDITNQTAGTADALGALQQAADRCLHLDASAAEGHFLHARLQQAHAHWDRAIPHLHDTIRRNPSFARAHGVLGQMFTLVGDPRQGRIRVEQADRLGPGAFVAGLALVCFCGGDFVASLDAAQRALATHPGYAFARAVAAAAAWELGRAELARTHAAELKRRNPTFSPEGFDRWFNGAGTPPVRRMVEALKAIH